jgi:hypothetical protein
LKGDLGNLPKHEINVWNGSDPDARQEGPVEAGSNVSFSPAQSSAASPSSQAGAAMDYARVSPRCAGGLATSWKMISVAYLAIVSALVRLSNGN